MTDAASNEHVVYYMLHYSLINFLAQLNKANKQHNGSPLTQAVVVYGNGHVSLKGRNKERRPLGNIETIDLSELVEELIRRRLLIHDGVQTHLDTILAEVQRTHPEYTTKELKAR